MKKDPRIADLIAVLRETGITDDKVLGALERIPRHLFVPSTFQDHAYDNTAQPIGHGQSVSQPQIVAMMTAALDLNHRCKVLEIGTGSGYQAAVLSKLCRRVYTIERYRSLLQQAERHFAELRLSNITTRVGDGMKGWPEQAPFERIIVTAAAAELPGALVDQLGPDGVMVLPLGRSSTEQEIVRVTRTAAGLAEENLLPVRFVPLLPGLAEDG